jgi:hypothetical protein
MAEEQQLPQTQAPEGHEEANAKPEEPALLPAAGTAEEEQGHDPPLPSMRVEGARQDPDQDPVARYRQKIEEFEADKEAPIGKLIRGFFVGVAYVAPVLCALLLGWEFGEVFGRGEFFFSLSLHALSLLGEIIIAGLALGAAHSLRRLASDRRQMLPRLLLCSLLFCLAASGSAFALWWLLATSERIPSVVLFFRVLIPLIVEIGSIAVISTLDFESLDSFLAALHRKAEAIQRLSEAELRLRSAEQEATNRQREYEEYRAMRQRNEEVLLRMLEIQSRGALAALERQVRIIEAEPEAHRPELPPAQPQQLQQEPLGWNFLLNGNGHQARK